MILGQAHRRTGAVVRDGLPRWGGGACHAHPLGCGHSHWQVEAPRAAQACVLVLALMVVVVLGSVVETEVASIGIPPGPHPSYELINSATSRSQEAKRQTQGALCQSTTASSAHRLIGLLEPTSSPVEVFGMCSDYSIRQGRCVPSPMIQTDREFALAHGVMSQASHPRLIIAGTVR